MNYLPQKHQETWAVLAERWPHLFMVTVPLKVGIHRDILAAEPRPVSSNKLHHFLYHWTHSAPYRATLKTATARYDLDGRICELGEMW